MSLRILALYFVVGGLAVSITTYFGSQGKGLLAAFVGMFPAATVITFCAIYYRSGMNSVTSYARGLLVLLPPWLLYVVVMYFLAPRLGLIPSLALGVALYAGISLLIVRLTA
jgi:uncharacterized membrane protein (GlpM family)